jgi:N-acetylneuraminic acid mutarotase
MRIPVSILVLAVLFGLVSGSVSACVPPLPEAQSNNAVAALDLGGKRLLFSFAGLGAGKTWRDTSKAAYMYTEGDSQWQRLPDLPVTEGRLAATAEAAAGMVYFFGGYTVAADGSEVSAPENFAFDPIFKTYSRIPDMPTPTDDAVSFVYKDRYIYLVSGWHNTGNIRVVQVYDVVDNSWFRASNYPGSPVFGHAGGIVGNQFVIADGVAVVGKAAGGRRQFATINEGWMGTIDPENPARITYRRLPQLPGKGNYRMAGAGDKAAGRVLFVGGTPNAYNYSGIGYNGMPSAPSAHVFAWDFAKDSWVAYPDKPITTMDHRGLLKVEGNWFTIGGMGVGQQVSAQIGRITPY